MSSVAPNLASRIAAEALFTPQGRRRSARGDAFLATGVREDRALARHRIAAWRFGKGPIVICLHGWAGSAAQFAAIAPALVARGRSVLAFDGPGHGLSTGRTSSLIELRDTLLALAQDETEPVAIVAHSGGAASATLAIGSGLRVARLAFVGPTIDPGALLEQSARMSGFSPQLLDGVKRYTETRFGIPWTALRVLPLAATRAEPLLVVHDEDDVEVPVSEGTQLADVWPQARLMLTRGLGHRRLLYDPAVVESVAAFITDGDVS